jgi:hypothetical protein
MLRISLVAASLTLAIGLGSSPSFAAEAKTGLDTLSPVTASDLGHARGGTDTVTSALEQNAADLSNSNGGSTLTTSNGALRYSGAISGTNLSGNSGMATVMANSGDMVNMNNATNINIYMR